MFDNANKTNVIYIPNLWEKDPQKFFIHPVFKL